MRTEELGRRWGRFAGVLAGLTAVAASTVGCAGAAAGTDAPPVDVYLSPLEVSGGEYDAGGTADGQAADAVDAVAPMDAEDLDLGLVDAAADVTMGDASASDVPLTDALLTDTLSDAADVPPLVDTQPDAAPDVAKDVDAGTPGLCFFGAPPAADAFVADMLQPDVQTCTPISPPSTWFPGSPPQPTLPLTLGLANGEGKFEPYIDGGWAPFGYGFQGGIHAWGGFTTQLPGVVAASVTLDVQVWADSGCSPVASGLGNLVSAVPDGKGGYTNVAPGYSPVMTQFYVPASAASQVCGQWITLHVRVHDPVSGAWGDAQVNVRMYDTKLPMP